MTTTPPKRKGSCLLHHYRGLRDRVYFEIHEKYLRFDYTCRALSGWDSPNCHYLQLHLREQNAFTPTLVSAYT